MGYRFFYHYFWVFGSRTAIIAHINIGINYEYWPRYNVTQYFFIDSFSDLAKPINEEYKLSNGGFELGNFENWEKKWGNTSVINNLGEFTPIEGSYMGFLFTPYTIVEQKICLPPEAEKLQFSFNFISEEFVESCYDIWYPDKFRVAIEYQLGGELDFFERNITELCDIVFPTSLYFDKSGPDCKIGYNNDCKVWATGWQTQTMNIQFSSRPVIVRIKVDGSASWASALLIDDIKILNE